MTKYDEMVSNLETAMIRFILNISDETSEKLSAAERELCDAIKDLQDQAAVSDINKIVQNLVEMRSATKADGISWTPVFAGDIPNKTMVFVKADRPIFHYMGVPCFFYTCLYFYDKFYMISMGGMEEVKGVTHYAIIDKVAK